MKEEFLLQYRPGQIGICNGLIYSPRKGGIQLAVQLLGVLVITCFAGAVASMLFGGLNLLGGLRPDSNIVRAGMDVIEGARAYPYFVIKDSAESDARDDAPSSMFAHSVPNLENGQAAAFQLARRNG